MREIAGKEKKYLWAMTHLAVAFLVGHPVQAAEDFRPTRSMVIDAKTAQQWKADGAQVQGGRLRLHFERVRISRDVQVTFAGFEQVTLEADEDVEILGAVTLEGGAGGDGAAGRGGQGGRGGDGGNGYGAGLPGQGGWPNGADGSSGAGRFGPGHPEPRGDASCVAGCADPAGGAASGSNGTLGGRGLGCWRGGLRYWEGEVLGRAEAFDTNVAPGGGSGGGGGCSRQTLAGGGGGGGGSSGALVIKSQGTILIAGPIRVSGGPGGRGGNGTRLRMSEACGAEGNACGGGGSGGAGGAGGYIVLEASQSAVLLRGETEFDVREMLQANGGAGGEGGEGNPTGASGPPGGGGRIRLIGRDGVYKMINDRRTPLVSQAGRPACWVEGEGQDPQCASSSQPGWATIFVGRSTGGAACGTQIQPWDEE